MIQFYVKKKKKKKKKIYIYITNSFSTDLAFSMLIRETQMSRHNVRPVDDRKSAIVTRFLNRVFYVNFHFPNF